MRLPLMICVAVMVMRVGHAQCYDLGPIDQQMQSIVQNTSQNGAVIWLHKGGTEIMAREYGGHRLDESLQIFSASKWLAGAVIMSLVEDNKLSLDDTAGQYLPTYSGDHARMTVRQMFSHTAGFGRGGQSVLRDRTITLQQAAVRLGSVSLSYSPGSSLSYGPISMHVAGAIAEIAGGKSWEQLFQDRVAGPLGMTNTTFGTGTNPAPARGATSTVRDYSRFLVMLLNGGVWNGRRILQQTSIDEMFKDQTRGATIVSTFHNDNRRYGVGCWRDRIDGVDNALQLSSQGIAGFNPWLDLEHGYAGIMSAKASLSAIYTANEQLQGIVRGVLPYAGVDCYGRATPVCASPIRAVTNAIPESGNATFTLGVRDANANAAGFAFVAAAPQSPALPLLDLEVFINPSVSAIFVLQTDGQGTADLPLSLVGIPPGTTAYTQIAIVAPRRSCAQALRATPGVRITVQ